MVQSGTFFLYKRVQSGTFWYTLVQSGRSGHQSDTIWYMLVPSGSLWMSIWCTLFQFGYNLVQYGTFWYNQALWYNLVKSRTLQTPIWYNLVPSESSVEGRRGARHMPGTRRQMLEASIIIFIDISLKNDRRVRPTLGQHARQTSSGPLETARTSTAAKMFGESYVYIYIYVYSGFRVYIYIERERER